MKEKKVLGVHEKMYKTLKNVGAANLAFGIVIIIAGVTVGVMSIVNQIFYFKTA